MTELDGLKAQLEALKVTIKEKEAALDTVAPYSRTYERTAISTILLSSDGGIGLVGRTMTLGGWVRTGREAGAGAFCFLELNDGSAFDNFQVMVDKEVAEASGFTIKDLVPTGTSVLVEGVLSETPENVKQAVELKAKSIKYVGPCDPTSYSLAKKKMTVEFLREKGHLRPRTNRIAAVTRIRNALAFATHTFFQSRGFLYVHTPLITASDCEGAGEMFQVTTLLSQSTKNRETPMPSAEEVEAARTAKAEADAALAENKAGIEANPGNKDLKKKQKSLNNAMIKATNELAQIEEKARMQAGLPFTANGEIDFTKDFFGRPSFLTVSGQLQGEIYACALSNIYTFGPTFRAEDSNTARHLAEFWMIEPEIAFCDLEDDMNCAEDYVRHCCKYLLDNCMPDLEFINSMIDNTALERLKLVAGTPFMRITYTEAVELLQEAIREKKVKFEFKVEWGIDLQSEHERYITEHVFKKPTIVYNYPKGIKAFYMRLNDDNKTVAAMDVLVPKVGELIGGSQREERLDVLLERLKEVELDEETYWWYIELRKYGSVPHSGFGLGFERLILFSTGVENIREAIPFPRWPGHASF